MLKVKNDWYVRIHKTLDAIRFDKNIIDLIINENLDDVLPKLPKNEAARVRDLEKRFWHAMHNKEEYLNELVYRAVTLFNSDRKEIATKFVPTLEDKTDAGFLFKLLDGHEPRVLLLDKVAKSVGSNVKWDECAEWMKVYD